MCKIVLHVFFVGSMLCPFLEDHKEDILCGPVWLASGLDLSGHAGMLSLTSPKLVKGNNSYTELDLLTTTSRIYEDVCVSLFLSCPVPPSSAGMAGGKYRSFLVHIKAVSDKGMEDSPRPVVRMPSAKPQSTKAHSLSTLLQRAQASKVQIKLEVS